MSRLANVLRSEIQDRYEFAGNFLRWRVLKESQSQETAKDDSHVHLSLIKA
jgi:hypothetical protein